MPCIHKLYLFLISMLFVPALYGQTVINKYAAVLSFNACTNTLTVDTATDFNVGDTVLMIQMKGATIDTTNTANFGSILNYNGAGNYELNVIKAKAGNVLTLKYIVKKAYNVPNGKVQLVRVPHYTNYTVSAWHTCLPWTGTKGGVFVVDVAGTLTLNDSISVSARGFKGAGKLNITGHTCNKTDYYYPNNNWGGAKGEGIATIGNDKLYGRGALANGAGGGNSHNSGGAGGGNGTAGGIGGNQYPLTGLCPTIIPIVGGIGGRALTYSNTANRIFMGGGGGAGHTNEQTDKDGGIGGGIVIIHAGTIDGNGKVIAASGGNVIECVGQTPGCANDGHSGGGGAGSILLDVTTYASNVQAKAIGGKGADAWVFNSTVLTTGPGGGGSGGVVWVNQAAMPGAVSTILTGGPNGVAKQPPYTAWGATAGAAGISLTGLQYLHPVDTFAGSALTVNFTDTMTGCSSRQFINQSVAGAGIMSYLWKFSNGATSTLPNPHISFASSGTYTATLIVTDNNGCVDSITKQVSIQGLKGHFKYSAVSGCFTYQFTDSSAQPGFTWFWDFGTGATSTQKSPLYTFPGYGTYTVTMVVTFPGACSDTIIQQIVVQKQFAVDFSIDTPDCRERLFKDLTNVSTGSVTWAWDFGNGGTSAQQNPPVVTYTKGTFNVKLVVTDNLGCKDSISKTVTIKGDVTLYDTVSMCPGGKLVYGETTITDTGSYTIVYPLAGCDSTIMLRVYHYKLPLASFDYTPLIPEMNVPTTFINQSIGGIKYRWDFGDKQSASEENPVHQYNKTGTYTVCLTAWNFEQCADTICKDISADVYPVIDLPLAFSPNGDGVNDILYVRGGAVREMRLRIYNRWGQMIFETRDMKVGWDGTYNGQPQEVDAVAYTLYARFLDGTEYKKTGNVSLVR